MIISPFTEEEIRQIRADTKGTADRIHFNNAGASLPPHSVVETIVQYLREEEIVGGYETEFNYKEQLDNTHALIARLINAGVDEVAIAENASSAWGKMFKGIRFKKGDEVITTEYEYATNVLAFLQASKTTGIDIKVVSNTEKGNFSLEALEAAITPRTKLIAVTHIPSASGGVIPIAGIGKIARKHNILYLVDACQSIGQLPIDVTDIQCDMLSVTGRKFLRAPRGTAFLYVRKEIQDQLEPVFMDGASIQWVTETDYCLRNDAKRFELFEKNYGLILGLGKAIEYALDIGVDRIWARIQQLAAGMRRQLEQIEGIVVRDTGDVKCGIVTFTVKGIDSVVIKERLGERHINVSIGSVASTLIFMNKHHLGSVVRASVHYYNTEEEVQTMCTALVAIIS
jgi:cysteine desulfurase / selenocysteine lyase